MKKLTEQEIRFIKDTGWTPTLVQMSYSESELKRTKFLNMNKEEGAKVFHKEAKKYHINLSKLYNKTCSLDSWDSISLEYEATYLLYTFFTKDELVDLDSVYALNWLKDFKYYCGFRKWFEGDVEKSIQESLEIHGGSREFYEESNGNIWNREVKQHDN